MTSLESIEKLRNRVNPMMPLNAEIIASEIEREIAEKYIELPVDADGVPIHIGDEMENGEYRGKVTDMSWDGHFCHVYHGSIAIAPCDYTHVEPRTVEDVLRDCCNEWNEHCGDDWESGVYAKYADELRELIKEGEL